MWQAMRLLAALVVERVADAWRRLLARLRRPDAPPGLPLPTEPIVCTVAGDPVGTVARVPIRNSRRDMKREVQQVMSQHTGRDLSPKAARKALKKLQRELRAQEGSA